ncbi:carbonic anhydrase [Andreprevotia lacus DSM 23236]|uniref:Carbonic anhydrase n=1 Tax=Andreprevotia lacus DSM 23236 TaxID=1121001 RepID=A0A1W1XQM6_9NEIS|nr:carbonic anhydrase [Andreprevotia lacus]SMC26290.1 carbonic anhydrase [Andreprevotia lacus DSM 23236]
MQLQDIEKFIGGFRRFQHKYFGEHHSLFDSLKTGQNPSSLVIGCSDSRVDPALLTDCDPGDLFVLRNVANLVPPYERDGTYHGVSAAIEYAVCDLEVRQIIILGHSGCGGIGGLMRGYTAKTEANFVGKWVQIALPAREQVLSELAHKTPAQQLRACEMASIIVSLDNLMSFPFIVERVEAGTLSLIGWYFDIQEGALYEFNRGSHRFVPLVAQIQR